MSDFLIPEAGIIGMKGLLIHKERCLPGFVSFGASRAGCGQILPQLGLKPPCRRVVGSSQNDPFMASAVARHDGI
jgi:hypothetical protein